MKPINLMSIQLHRSIHVLEYNLFLHPCFFCLSTFANSFAPY